MVITATTMTQMAAIDLRRDSSLVCHSERNEESRKPDKRIILSTNMTEERLSALSRFKWVAQMATETATNTPTATLTTRKPSYRWVTDTLALRSLGLLRALSDDSG